MYSTGRGLWMRTGAEEGALPARMDPAGGEPWMRKKDKEESMEEEEDREFPGPARGSTLRSFLKLLLSPTREDPKSLEATLVERGHGNPKKKEDALLVGMASTAWPLSSWEQALLEFPGVDFTWIPLEFCLEFNREFMSRMKRQPESLDIQNALAAIQASFGNSTRIGCKSVIDEVISPETEESETEAVKKAGRPEESVTEAGKAEEAVDQAVINPETEKYGTEAVKEAEEGVLLVGPTAGRIADTLLVGTNSPGGALLVGMDYTGGVSSMRNQAEEGITLLAGIVPAVVDMHSVGAKAKAKEMEAKANDEEAWKAEVHVTEAGKADEAVTLGSSKSAMEDEEIGTETLQQLVKVMPNKFDILDPDGDDEKDERIDRGKSAIEKSARKAKAKANEEAGNRQKLIGNKTLQQLLKDMPNKFDILDPDGDDEKDEIDGGKSTIDEETVHAEEPMAPVPKYYFGLPPEYGEKVRKHNEKMKAEQEAMLARFEKLCQSKRSANSAGAGDSFIPAADPSATKSVGHYSVQDDLDYHDRGNSASAQAKRKTAKKKTAKKTTAAGKEMAHEAESFDLHRTVWEFKHGKRCGSFSETTVLSSMQFTHYTPGLTPHSSFCCTPKTLQIFSIKLTRLDGGLKFPLSVYGVVAVRDMVDRNRNILFFRDFTDRQELKQEKVCIEIELRVVAGSQDAKALITCAQRYSGGYGDGLHTICFKNRFCTLEVSSQPVKQTIQATILSVEVLDHKESAWPLEYGGLIACSPLSGKVVITGGRFSRNIDPPSSPPIVLVHSKHEAVPKGKGGFVHLWRQVVSVELQGRLDFDIKSYSKSGAIAAEASACFEPKVCNTSLQRCLLGDAEVTITVAWSRVATCKTGVALQHCARRCF